MFTTKIVYLLTGLETGPFRLSILPNKLLTFELFIIMKNVNITSFFQYLLLIKKYIFAIFFNHLNLLCYNKCIIRKFQIRIKRYTAFVIQVPDKSVSVNISWIVYVPIYLKKCSSAYLKKTIFKTINLFLPIQT